MEIDETKTRIRNLSAFWLLGLTNNFGYVVMLSAANDILKDTPDAINGTDIETTTVPAHPSIHCNKIGTGAILLADILPALFIKLTAPFFVQYFRYFCKVSFVILCGIGSFPIVSSSHSMWQTILGVVFASVGSGLGEITYLSLSTYYEGSVISTWGSGTGMAGVAGSVISTWGSGTGMAGVAGALIYAALTSQVVGLSPQTTLYIMTVVPIIQAVSYFLLLAKPRGFDPSPCASPQPVHYDLSLGSDEEVAGLMEGIQREPSLQTNSYNPTLTEKFSHIKVLLKYMVPLGLVYFAEYFINQALFELLQFENTTFTTAEQYRWYQVSYQIGVFVSRSSLGLVKIRHIWILSILQFGNLTFLLLQVVFHFVPFLWILLVFILWEGLLGGAAYVNTFFRVTTEVEEEKREFSMGVVSVADSFGIAIAGFTSIPVHNALCEL